MAGQLPQQPEQPQQAAATEPSRFDEEDTSSYRDGFKAMLWLIKLETLVMLVMTGVVAYYISFVVPEDTYFAIGVQGNNEKLMGLKEPNLNHDALLAWVSSTATQVMTFGFDDIDERFALAKTRFSPDGWKSFQKAIIRAGILKDVVLYQQLITAIPISTPTIIAEGEYEGIYRWIVNVQIIETTRAGNKKLARKTGVSMILVKMPTLANPMGIGIHTWSEG
jgi:hypothetical protein